MPGPGNFKYQSGFGKTSAFMVSGNPWITGSYIDPSGTFSVNFPRVSKSITVINSYTTAGLVDTRNTGSLAVYFGPAPAATWNGANIGQITNNHYIELDDVGDSVTFDVRCAKIHVTCLGYNGLPTTDSAFEALNVSGSFVVLADLSSIDSNDASAPALTGSGIDA